MKKANFFLGTDPEMMQTLPFSGQGFRSYRARSSGFVLTMAPRAMARLIQPAKAENSLETFAFAAYGAAALAQIVLFFLGSH